MSHKRIEQQTEGLSLTHDGLAMQSSEYEVLHRFDIVLLERVPCPPDFLALGWC
ncbi:hypothetical protein D3C85_1896510 [compost metagenome]